LESKYRIKPRRFHDSFRIGNVDGKRLFTPNTFDLKSELGIEDENFQKLLNKEISFAREHDRQLGKIAR